MTTRYNTQKLLAMYIKRAKLHWLSPYPNILKILGNVKKNKILDFGCGNGELTKKFYDLGADVTGIDCSNIWIDYCIERHGEKDRLKFFHINDNNLKQLKSKFDIVVMNMVLLNVERKRDVEKIIKEVSNVLNKGGTLIFSDLHPLCIMAKRMPTRSIKHSKRFSYFLDGARYKAIANAGKNKIEFSNRHWTLEMYTFFLDKFGMNIYRIIEPHYKKSVPRILQSYKIPEYILFCCKKH